MVVFINDSKKINITAVSEELLRGSSVLKVPFFVRYLVSFCTAFVPKQHLRQFPYIVSVNYEGVGDLHIYVPQDLRLETLLYGKTLRIVTKR